MLTVNKTVLTVLNKTVLTVLNNLHLHFHSVKVTSLLSTMALFTSTDIYLPIMVIDVITFRNRYNYF